MCVAYMLEYLYIYLYKSFNEHHPVKGLDRIGDKGRRRRRQAGRSICTNVFVHT